MERSGGEVHLAASHGHDWWRRRAAEVLRDDILRVLVVMPQPSDVAATSIDAVGGEPTQAAGVIGTVA
jgi:hypothetical protein